MVDREEKKIKITVKTKKKKKANNTDRNNNNSLEAQSNRNELAHALLLVKALRESLFVKSDGEEGSNFVLGSMQRLSADMWKNKKEVI
jgi:hypothetical protein